MSGRAWTDEQHAALVARYPHESTVVLAADLGRSLGSVHQRALSHGLRKTAEYLASEVSGRILRGQQSEAMRATQFKPGLVPWNKGIPFDSGGRSVDTRFKPGRPASEARNYAPIGSERITRDGILERKVTDDPALAPARRWVAVARLVWETDNGPVPAGHAVVFKPGRATTDAALITLDAIELVSRAELMRRNSYLTRYPKEVADVIRLRGALNRKINRRSKAA